MVLSRELTQPKARDSRELGALAFKASGPEMNGQDLSRAEDIVSWGTEFALANHSLPQITDLEYANNITLKYKPEELAVVLRTAPNLDEIGKIFGSFENYLVQVDVRYQAAQQLLNSRYQENLDNAYHALVEGELPAELGFTIPEDTQNKAAELALRYGKYSVLQEVYGVIVSPESLIKDCIRKKNMSFRAQAVKRLVDRKSKLTTEARATMAARVHSELEDSALVHGVFDTLWPFSEDVSAKEYVKIRNQRSMEGIKTANPSD